MRCRRRAEQSRERQLPGVIEVMLVAEEDHLVFEQRSVDRRDGPGVEVTGQGDAVDPGSDMRAQLGNFDGSHLTSVGQFDASAQF